MYSTQVMGVKKHVPFQPSSEGLLMRNKYYCDLSQATHVPVKLSLSCASVHIIGNGTQSTM